MDEKNPTTIRCYSHFCPIGNVLPYFIVPIFSPAAMDILTPCNFDISIAPFASLLLFLSSWGIITFVFDQYHIPQQGPGKLSYPSLRVPQINSPQSCLDETTLIDGINCNNGNRDNDEDGNDDNEDTTAPVATSRATQTRPPV